MSHSSEPTEKLREQNLLLSKCPCGCHCLLSSAGDKVQASKAILLLHWKETLFIEPKFLGRKRLASKTCKFPQSTPSDSEDRLVLCVVCPAWGTNQPPTETELLGSQSVLYCFHTSQGCNFLRVPVIIDLVVAIGVRKKI